MATNQVNNMRNSNNRFKGSFFPVKMVESKIHIFGSLAKIMMLGVMKNEKLIFASLVKLRAV